MISHDLREQIDAMDRWLGPLAAERFEASDRAGYRTLRRNLGDLLDQLEHWERATGPAACVAQAPGVLPEGVIDLARVLHGRGVRTGRSLLRVVRADAGPGKDGAA